MKSLRQTLEALLHLYTEDKKDRKEERAASEALRIRELEKLEDARKEEVKVTREILSEQAKSIKKLQQKFIWATGFIAALTVVFHELGDLIAPIVRHLIH